MQKKSRAGRALALSRAAAFLAIKSLRGTRPFSLAPQKKTKKISRESEPLRASIPNTLAASSATRNLSLAAELARDSYVRFLSLTMERSDRSNSLRNSCRISVKYLFQKFLFEFPFSSVL